MTRECCSRDWDRLVARHRAFWSYGDVERPLIAVTHDHYVDTELVASVMGDGELHPEGIDPRLILAEYDKVANARDRIGDDMIAVAEPLLGIPWLEAICGCRVMVVDGKSLWPEPQNSTGMEDIAFSEDNPWLRALLRVLHQVVHHAAGRYAVGLSHLRGPADVLAARLGSQRFLLALYDEPERITALARQVARIWLAVARAQARIVPPYQGGYGVRQFGLWAPAPAVWLQDDTSSMLSLDHYRHLFLEALGCMSAFPYGVLHLHIPSLHLAETLAQVPNVRAINLYFDSEKVSLQDAMPTLQRLQARRVPLILAKDVYEGFSIHEYEEILSGLSPQGLSVHLQAHSIEEGRETMGYVRTRAHRAGTG